MPSGRDGGSVAFADRHEAADLHCWKFLDEPARPGDPQSLNRIAIAPRPFQTQVDPPTFVAAVI